MTKNVLLIEDNDSDIELTRRAFRKVLGDCNLIVAKDGQQALDYLFTENSRANDLRHWPPDLVLLDLNLPRVDGLTILRRIRKDVRTRELIVVILTSSAEPEDLKRAYQIGINSYIRKPVDFTRFEDIVSQLGRYWLATNLVPPRSDHQP